MTKIKNTKKGMAKKTLSMSLVVAMLATSNVPVWAAEFSDGSDVAVETEADAFVADEAETPAVEDTTENVTSAEATTEGEGYEITSPAFQLNAKDFTEKSMVWTNSDKTVQDGNKLFAKFTLSAKEGTSTTGIEYYYAWKIGGTAEEAKAISNLGQVTTDKLTLDGNAAGKDVTLFVYAKANDGKTVWSYTSDPIRIDAAVDPKLATMSTTYNPTYNGKEQQIPAGEITANGSAINEDDYNITVSGNATDVTDEGVTVTITPKTAGYTGKAVLNYKIKSLKLDGAKGETITKHFKATLKTKNFTYTGKVIRVKASDVALTDVDTGADLSGYLKADEKGYVSLKSISAQSAGETTFELNLATPESGNRNYEIPAGTVGTKDGYSTIVTDETDKATIAKRDLSTVNVSIKSMAIPANNVINQNDLDITYTDKTTGEELNLDSNVTIATITNVTKSGDYTVTIEPKAQQYNVIGNKITATVKVVAADLSKGQFQNSAYGNGSTDKQNNVLVAEDYTGSEITKTEEQLGSFTVDGKVLDKDLYTIEYSKNKDAGTAKLIVKGKGSFEGSEAVFTFTINPAKVSSDTITTKDKVEQKDTQNASDYKDDLGLVVKAKNKNGKEFTLVNGTDYTVKYSYDDDTKKTAADGGKIFATITVTNKNFTVTGGVSGSTTVIETKKIPLALRALKSENIKLEETSFTYNGKVVEPDFDIVVDGHYKATKAAIDNDKVNSKFNYTFTNNINAGTATLTVTPKSGNGEFDPEVSAKVTFDIKPADASKLVGVIASRQYKGYSLEIPADEINLKLGDDVIDVADNFKITNGENRNIGQGTVTLTPKNGNFTGTKTITFDIVGKLLGSGTITGYDANGIETTGDCTYDGTEHKFAKVVADIKDGNKKLVEGTDYDLVYVDNVYGKKGTKTVGGNPVDVQRGAVLAIAKGTYGGSLDDAINGVVKGVYTDAAGNKIANVIAIKTFEIGQLNVDNSSVVVKNATYAGGLSLKPEVTIVVKGVTLVEGKDYTLSVEGSKDLVNATTGKVNTVAITFKNGYKGNVTAQAWGIDKFDLANADVTVKDGKLSVKCGKVEVDTAEYTTTVNADGTTTIAAAKASKNYTGSKTVKTNGATEAEKPAAPMISSVKVVGNKATAILSGDSDGAAGYDYVISTDRDCITNKDYASVNKNQVQTSTTFKYVQQGTYYAYCHAWKRDENGKKVFSDWSNAYPFVVSAITPDAPVITNVKVSGSTIKVTYKAAANATGYDVVLGTGSKKENGETRPYQYGNHKKLNLKEGTVTATFKNVPKGTWVVGMHAFNRTSEDGKKVFSPWSNLKKATVK